MFQGVVFLLLRRDPTFVFVCTEGRARCRCSGACAAREAQRRFLQRSPDRRRRSSSDMRVCLRLKCPLRCSVLPYSDSSGSPSPGYLFKFISVVFLSEMLKKDMQFFILGNIF